MNFPTILFFFLLNPSRTLASTQKETLAEEWKKTLDALEGYKYFYDNINVFVEFHEYGAYLDEEVEKLSNTDRAHVRHGWFQYEIVCAHLAGFHKELEKFFESQAPIMSVYNREQVEISIWIPSEIVKYEQFFTAFLKIRPTKLNMRKMRKSLLILAAKSDRIEVEYILDAVNRLQGIQDPEIDLLLVQKTKKALGCNNVLESVNEKKAECPPVTCNQIYYQCVYVSLLLSITTTLFSMFRTRAVYNWKQKMEKNLFERIVRSRKTQQRRK